MKLKLTIFSFKEFIAALLIFLFLYTALTKFYDIPKFEAAMSLNSLLFPYANSLKWLVPVIELIIVILLFIPSTRKSGILVSAILLGIFSIYIGYMLLSNSNLPCTCGGIIENMNWKQHLIFNIVMIALSIIALLRRPKRFVATNRSSRIPV